LAALENRDRRNTANPKRLGRNTIRLSVQFKKGSESSVFIGYLAKSRRKSSAWRTPRRPKVDNDRERRALYQYPKLFSSPIEDSIMKIDLGLAGGTNGKLRSAGAQATKQVRVI
jgi:hypothetical protein